MGYTHRMYALYLYVLIPQQMVLIWYSSLNGDILARNTIFISQIGNEPNSQ